MEDTKKEVEEKVEEAASENIEKEKVEEASEASKVVKEDAKKEIKMMTERKKEKDPRRVAAGKKLGAISRAAKLAKKQRLERESGALHEIEGEALRENSNWNLPLIIAGVGMFSGLACLYFSYRQDKREALRETEKVEATEPQEKTPQPNMITFD